MKKRTKIYFLRYFSYLLFAGLITFYFVLLHGALDGLCLTLLTWSLYILVIPGSHGQYLFGGPPSIFKGIHIYTEPFLWNLAILGNVLTYFVYPKIYTKTFLTHFLYRVITTPNPYWFIIFISALGTFYNFLTRQHYYLPSSYKHLAIRYILVLIGLFTFLYLSHREIIFLLNEIM